LAEQVRSTPPSFDGGVLGLMSVAAWFTVAVAEETSRAGAGGLGLGLDET
jgi:hypothetical protein